MENKAVAVMGCLLCFVAGVVSSGDATVVFTTIFLVGGIAAVMYSLDKWIK